eukprot:CAMPEP_0185822094 /NCGR_PEP_ID=MMETSP1322-20130828/26187_1 /TAXON_ID=265543 /ORGANISM="Minutocellus polymorphus, Strain RCC2270" /LENGTH=83 /DNA_ID=CAMNT_0028519517 /DNA_START=413 /DNA_END=660 /DNA_ORIENTATION=-
MAPRRNQVRYAVELVNGTPRGFDTKLGTWPCGGNEGTIGTKLPLPPIPPLGSSSISAAILVLLAGGSTSLGELDANPSTTRYA